MKNITVFIIDDEQEVTDSLAWLLESVGYQVQTYASAQSFLENHVLPPLGCIILDIRMPEIDGLTLQDILLQKSINLPIIFITGYGDIPTAVQAMKAGALDFLTKPVNHNLLLETVAKAIKHYAQQNFQQQQQEKIFSLAEKLTPREYEIMEFVVAGYLKKTIAAKLEISVNTVELHRGKIMKKMQVNTLAELVNVSIGSGLVATKLHQFEE